jgi:hypothetical protein
MLNVSELFSKKANASYNFYYGVYVEKLAFTIIYRTGAGAPLEQAHLQP